MKILASRRFISDLDKLSKKEEILKKKVVKTLQVLSHDVQHPSLRFHKLIANETYSISVTMRIRIILRIDERGATLLRIGNHDEVY